jgi:hypothetical protein
MVANQPKPRRGQRGSWLFPHQRSWDTTLRYGSTLGGEETSAEEAITMLVFGYDHERR